MVAGTGSDEFPALPSELPQDWTRPVEPVFPLMSTDPPEFPSLTPPVAATYGTPNPPLLSAVSGPDEFAQVAIPEFLNQPALPAGESSQVILPKPAPGLKMKDPTVKVAVLEVKSEGSTGAEEQAGATGIKPESIIKATEVAKGESQEPVLAGGETKAGTEKFLPSLTPSTGEEVIPFGSVVSGRPGYVRSPFAKAHQVVDVSGLKVGDVVKCPFSGRFFRVPAMQEAMNRTPTEGEKGAAVVETKAVPEAATPQGTSDKPE
jgi:hypothetical protein